MFAIGGKALGQKTVILLTAEEKLDKKKIATAFVAAASCVTHWKSEFVLVVARLGELLEPEAERFREK